MAPTSKKRRSKKNHIGSSPNSAIVLRPPSPPSVPAFSLTNHVHRKNQKGRVIIHIWSRRFTACYETEVCPDCPVEELRDQLSSFAEADKGFFASARWLTFEGLNHDTLKVCFSPASPVQMSNFAALIKKRDRHGGKVTLRIVRRGQAISFWIVFVSIMIVVVSLGITSVVRKHDGINATFLSMLTNVFSGVINEVLTAIYKF